MLEIKGEQFFLNGKPFQFVCGSIHYFRIVPEYWRDRLEKLKAIGCNTIEMYIPWNFHEQKKGEYRFDGWRDIERFWDIANELGLYILLRPSPYICAEWEFGGLPYWLLKDRGMHVRCSYPPYLKALRAWYEVLMPKVVAHQIDRGGNIIMIQIENEYAGYGNDLSYLEFIRDTMRELGVTVPFNTCDGATSTAFNLGQVEGALACGNFGSRAEERLGLLRDKQIHKGPLMCTEFWLGWFDAWGREHAKTPPEQNQADLEIFLQKANANLYMFHGGTSFGFMNGSNYSDEGRSIPIVTSYDCDAALSEDGRITPKYLALQKTISKYHPIPEVKFSMDIKRKAYGEVKCCGQAALFDVLETIASPVKSSCLLSMEDIDQMSGYIVYRTRATSDEPLRRIWMKGMADRVHTFVDGKLTFVALEDEARKEYIFEEHPKGTVVNFLVENMGRVDYGRDLETQRKGIVNNILFNGLVQYGYEIFGLPLEEDQLRKIDFSGSVPEGMPGFYRFEFDVDEPADTFVDFGGFGKGCIFINGFNLGRFWEIGPQKRLYLPAPLLKAGKNEIIVFETEGKVAESLTLADEPDLG